MDPEALARRLAELADSKQASEIVALDMRELVSYTDFLVICTAPQRAPGEGDQRRGGAAAEARREPACRARSREGPAAGWVVLDYLDCVLHVFTPEARDRYRLEQLWEDAPRLELGLAGEALEHRAARA